MATTKNLFLSAIIFITTVVMALDYFLVYPAISNLAGLIGKFVIPISALAMTFGGPTLAVYYTRRIARKDEYWEYSALGLAAFIFFIAIGFFEPQPQPLTSWISINILVVLSNSIMAVIAFYMTSAAYRTMRFKTLEGSLLLITVILVMLGNAPIGGAFWTGFPIITEWILGVPNTAGLRGLNIVVALGTFVIGLRMFLGRERTVAG